MKMIILTNKNKHERIGENMMAGFVRSLLVLVLIIGIYSSNSVHAEDDSSVNNESMKAFEEYKSGKTDDAFERLNKLVKGYPENARVYYLRAVLYKDSGEYQKAADDYSKVMKLKPKDFNLYHDRGVCFFNLGKFKKSVEDFDRFLEKNPEKEAHHWQRGISHYYAKMYAEGRKQFEVHQNVNSQDVENAVWHFLCVTRDESLEAAEKGLIDIQGDSRIPMMKVHELFQGKTTVKDVLAKAEEGAETIPKNRLKMQRFYAHLYLGLYYEAHKKVELAKKHIHLAATKYSVRGYMGDVARVHDQVYQNQKKD